MSIFSGASWNHPWSGFPNWRFSSGYLWSQGSIHHRSGWNNNASEMSRRTAHLGRGSGQRLSRAHGHRRNGNAVYDK